LRILRSFKLSWVVALALSASIVGLLVTPTVSQATTTKYYVSLGDSYSVGYQPKPLPGGATAGYTGYVAKKEHLTLKNFGCGGATTSSILTFDGCVAPYGPPAKYDGVSYPGQTQAAAAEAFITAHHGQIGLITVSIGGNDVTSCATQPDPTTCVTGRMPGIKANVAALAEGLRSAAGPGVPIIGLTYPDVLLGAWVNPGGSSGQSLAKLSVTAFKLLINPGLSKSYATALTPKPAKADEGFVDVTKDTGAYVPLTKTVTLAPYGKIPSAVAQVCKLTWYCTLQNIHAKTVGYNDIGKFIAAEYAKLK